MNEAGVRERKRCGSIIRVSRIVSVEALCMLDKEEEGEDQTCMCHHQICMRIIRYACDIIRYA